MENPVALGWRVSSANRDQVTALARKSHMSAAAFFELMVENLQLDERGVPGWVPHDEDEGQLPIDKP